MDSNSSALDLFLAGICLNMTCLEESTDQISEKRMKLLKLGESLRGVNLTIVTTQNYPLSYAVEENGTWVGKGVAFVFLDFLKEKFKFEYTTVIPNEDILGDDSSGIFGMIYNKKADVAAAFLPIIAVGRQYVRYSTNLGSTEWVVLLTRPKESAQGSGLLAPFTLDVWILILLFLLTVGPIIHGLIVLRQKLCRDDKNKMYPLKACAWFVYGALLRQGSTLSPMSDSVRLLFATWWIFITILTSFYTANLTAFLTLSQFTLPINSANDIREKNYKWVTRKGNAIEEAVNNVKDALYFENSTGAFVTDNGSYIINEWVKKHNYMYLEEQLIVDYWLYQDYLDKAHRGIEEAKRCTYVATPWTILTRSRAFAYRQDFEFIEVFDVTLRYLLESGLFKHLTTMSLPSTKICPLNLGSKERQLRNSDLLMTYLVVIFGFTVSALIFIIEAAIHNWHKIRPMLGGKSSDFKRRSEHFYGNSSSNNNISYYYPPPPSYNALFGPPKTDDSSLIKRKIINGRDYWVITTSEGNSRLIPMRTPSAILFQYPNH